MFRVLSVLALAGVLVACGPSKEAKANLTEGQAYLAANARKPGVVVLPSGLQYRIDRSGPQDGARPRRGDEIKVHYEGVLLDGRVFDSSYNRGVPAVMPLEGLVQGWMMALPRMRVGDVWTLYVPPELGYGEEGAGGGEIPPNAVLVFKLELLGVLPRASGSGGMSGETGLG